MTAERARGLLRHARRLVAAALFVVVAVVLLRAVPRFGEVIGTLRDVDWRWASLAVAANVASLVVRGFGWRFLLRGALADRDAGGWPAVRAYLVGQLVNAMLPGRTGELTKIGIYANRLQHPKDDWGVVGGAVVAHRLIDVIPLGGLIFLLVISVGIPERAQTEVFSVLLVSLVLLASAALLTRHREEVRNLGPVHRVVHEIRDGLTVLHSVTVVLHSLAFQSIGWTIEVVGVWVAFRAFDVDAPLAAAGLVVVATNAVTLFPFWPSNIGAFQVAVATMLEGPRVEWAVALGFGFGLQGIETLASLAAGLPAAAREGIRLG